MTSFGGSGGSGVARGRVTVDLSGLMTARNSLIQATKQMDDALAGVGNRGATGINRVEAAVRGLNRSLSAASTAAAGLFAAAATGGLAAASQVNRINSLFKVLTGSEQAATKAMDELREMADRTGQPFLQLVEGSTTLLPALRSNTEELARTVGIAQRLAILDPLQGIEGASIAIRELLAGDYISLARRFELPRSQLQRLIDTADGDIPTIINGLDQMVNELGLTEQAMAEMGQDGVFVFAQVRDEVKQTLAQAFTPLLKDGVLPLLRAVGQLARAFRDIKIPPELITAATALSAGRLAGRIPGVGPGAARGIGRAAGVGVAAYGGIQAGAFISRKIDPSLGSQEDALKTLSDRFKQIIVVITEGFERGSRAFIGGLQKVAEIFLTGRIVLRNAFENIGEGLRQVPPLIIGMFENMIGEVIGLFAGLMESVVDALDDLPLISGGAFRGGSEGLRDVASGLQSRGQERRDVASGAISNLLGPTAEETAAIAAQLDQTFGGVNTALDGMTESMYDLLFPAQEVEEAVNPLEAVFQNMANRFQRMGENVRRFREIQQEVLSELAEEQARIDADRERDALRDQEDFARQRIQALEDFHRQQARSEADFYRNRERSIADFNRENADAVTDFERDRLEAQQDFARQSAEAAEDHERKLERIARDGREAVLDAASRLDARGVAQAMRSTERRMRDERDEFARERAERQRDMQERLTEQQQNFAEQRSQRVENFQRQLADQQENFDRSRAQQLEDFNLRIQRENDERAIRAARQAEDFAREDAMRQAEAQKRINDLLQEANLQRSIIGNMLSAWTSGLEAAANYAINFVSRLRQMFQNTSVSRAARSFGSGVSNAVSGVGTVLSNSGFGATVNAISSIGSAAAGALGGLLGFQTGGVARGSGLAMVHDKERVLSPAQTASFDRLVAAMEGGGAGPTINATININGDTGGRSDSDFKRLFYESMDDLLDRAERSSGKGTR